MPKRKRNQQPPLPSPTQTALQKRKRNHTSSHQPKKPRRNPPNLRAKSLPRRIHPAKHPVPPPQHNPKPGQHSLPRPLRPLPPITDSNANTSLTELHQHTTLLQALYARHRNQHRAQPWFKALSLLLRALRRLLVIQGELASPQSGNSSYSFSVSAADSRGDNKGEGKGRGAAEEVRLRFERQKQLSREKVRVEEWVREVLLPEAYVGCSRLVGDGEGWAGLGVVGVGVVAGVAGVVGVPSLREELVGGEGEGSRDESLGSGNVERGREESKTRTGGLGQVDIQEERKGESEGDDAGVLIDRKSLLASPLNQTRSITTLSDPGDEEEEHSSVSLHAISLTKSTRRASHTDSTPLILRETTSTQIPEKSRERKNKNKMRKKNAIDDLFAGLT